MDAFIYYHNSVVSQDVSAWWFIIAGFIGKDCLAFVAELKLTPCALLAVAVCVGMHQGTRASRLVNLNGARFEFGLFQSLWNLTGTSAEVLWIHRQCCRCINGSAVVTSSAVLSTGLSNFSARQSTIIIIGKRIRARKINRHAGYSDIRGPLFN